MNKKKKVEGYKGFDKNLTCRTHQYEIGKTYKTEKVSLCDTGFHFCTNPLDVFGYYPPADSRYAEVVASGKMQTEEGGDSKVVCSELHIKAEIGLIAMIAGGVKFILDKVDWKNAKESNTGNYSAATNTGYRSAATNTGYRSAATNTGYYSAATNTGDYSAATNTGDYSAATNTGNYSAATNTGYQSAATNTGDYSAATNTGYQSAATNTGYQSAAEVSGKESVACGLGVDNKARGIVGCWLVLSEWEKNPDKWELKEVKAVIVDGVNIKADTWYTLVNGEFKEAE